MPLCGITKTLSDVESVRVVHVEPVCTIPAYRGKGIARALIFEAFRRAKNLGATRAYVISDMEFYERLGFRKKYHYSFFWKKDGK